MGRPEDADGATARAGAGAGGRARVIELARARKGGDPFAFRLDAQEYLVRGDGGSYRAVEVPWGDALLELLGRVHHSPEARQRVGALLRQVLGPAEWDAVERAAVEGTARHPFVLTIRAAAAELYALPWELVTVRATGQHIAELPGCVIRYEWPGDGARAPATGSATPRIVYAWSSAGGGVPAEEQREAIGAACAAGHVSFGVEDVVQPLSPRRLAAALDAPARPPVVLHLLCHGGPEGLRWDREDGGEGALAIDGAALRRLLQPYADTLELIVLSACSSADPGAFGDHLGSLAQALHRAGVARAVVASRYPLTARGATTLTRHLYDGLLRRRDSLERSLLRARGELCREPGALDWAGVQLYARAQGGEDTRPLTFRPYRGLLSFDTDHGAFFFGRDAEISTLATRIEVAARDHERGVGFQLVLGTSGSGKSSLVRAGLIPRLRETGPWRFVIVRPGDRGGDPVGSLLAETAAAEGASASRVGHEDPVAAIEALLLGDDAPVRGHPEDTSPPTLTLIVVDQLEEIFTHVEPAAAERFTRALWRLARSPRARVAVIATMRVDVLERSNELVLDGGSDGSLTGARVRFGTIAYDDECRLLLGPPGPAAMRAIIEGPARAVGLELQAGLVDQIVVDAEGRPGALPLLQHALDSLWRAREGRTLTLSAYRALGGITGALTRTADDLIAAMNHEDQGEARRVLLALVDLGADWTPRGRRRALIAELRPAVEDAVQRFERVKEQLVRSRLIVEGTASAVSVGEPSAAETETDTLELAHEALIREWPRLREWLEEDRDALREIRQVELWCDEWLARAGSPDQQMRYLEEGDRLERARRVMKRHPERLTDRVQRFLDQSEWLEEARRRRALLQKNQMTYAALLMSCAYCIGTNPILDVSFQCLVVLVAGNTAWLWELAISERVDFVSALDFISRLILHGLLLTLAFACVHGEVATGDAVVTWLLVGLSIPRIRMLTRLAMYLPPGERGWVLGIALPVLIAAPLWIIAFFAGLPARVYLWWAAIGVEGTMLLIINLRGGLRLPPILSEGYFANSYSRIQEMLVVGALAICLVGVASSPGMPLDTSILLTIGLIVSCPVFASVGHEYRHGVKLKSKGWPRYVWLMGQGNVVAAHILWGAVGYHVAVGHGSDPVVRWAWAFALVLLLTGTAICGIGLEVLKKKRRFARFYVYGMLIASGLPVAVTAATIDASTTIWAIGQVILMFGMGCFISAPFNLRSFIHMRTRG